MGLVLGPPVCGNFYGHQQHQQAAATLCRHSLSLLKIQTFRISIATLYLPSFQTNLLHTDEGKEKSKKKKKEQK